MVSNLASSSLEVKPDVISWAGLVVNEVCGREKRSGQRGMRPGPAAKYLLSRERGNGEAKPREKRSK